MFLKRSIPGVGFSTEEVGTAFANASDKQQREILRAMVNATDDMARHGGSWPMQCRAIIDGCNGDWLSASERSRIGSMLDCLLDHLREPVKE